MKKKSNHIILFILLIITATAISRSNKIEKNPYYKYDKQGNLFRPKDYRSWIFAGTVASPKILDPNVIFPDFQNIYIDPISFKFWKKNGYFREGTIFVKELLKATDRRELPIGKGFVQGKVWDVAVTIKDTARYPKAPGGWEYFDFVEDKDGNYDEFSPVMGNTGCIACHSKSETGYGPFSELYAPLRDAQGFDKDNPENLSNRNKLPSYLLRYLNE
ncbi:cytochrome P460 family protein [Chryseobacterium sp. Chry.R1]|uniref:cytochrome P460 family protein n=1 Tax=Chryseobacterium sp. Chry.R1 TaxID=3139392 RepID=UPI0031F7F534